MMIDKKVKNDEVEEVHAVDEPKVSKLGILPSLPLWVCLSWYVGVLIFGIVCRFISYDVTINTVEGAEFFSIFMKLSCLSVQHWLCAVGIFGGTLSFLRKRKGLDMFFSWFSIISIFIVIVAILGFIF